MKKTELISQLKINGFVYIVLILNFIVLYFFSYIFCNDPLIFKECFAFCSVSLTVLFYFSRDLFVKKNPAIFYPWALNLYLVFTISTVFPSVWRIPEFFNMQSGQNFFLQLVQAFDLTGYNTIVEFVQKCSFFLLMFIAFNAVRKQIVFEHIIYLFCLFLLIMSVIGIFEYFGFIFAVRNFWMKQRIALTFGNPNYYGGLLTLCLPLVYTAFTILKKNWLKIIVASIAVLTWINLFFTGQRWAVFVSAVIIIIFTVLYFFFCIKMSAKKKIKQAVIYLIIIIILLVLCILLYSVFNQNFRNRIINVSFKPRLLAYDAAVKIWLKNPFSIVFGNGAGSFFKHFFTFYNAEIFPLGRKNYTHVHNEYLEMLVEGGIFGFFTFLAFVLYILYNLSKVFRNSSVSTNLKILSLGHFCLILAYLLLGIMSITTSIITTSYTFYFFCGIACSVFFLDDLVKFRDRKFKKQKNQKQKKTGRKIFEQITGLFKNKSLSIIKKKYTLLHIIGVVILAGFIFYQEITCFLCDFYFLKSKVTKTHSETIAQLKKGLVYKPNHIYSLSSLLINNYFSVQIPNLYQIEKIKNTLAANRKEYHSLMSTSGIESPVLNEKQQNINKLESLLKQFAVQLQKNVDMIKTAGKMQERIDLVIPSFSKTHFYTGKSYYKNALLIDSESKQKQLLKKSISEFDKYLERVLLDFETSLYLISIGFLLKDETSIRNNIELMLKKDCKYRENTSIYASGDRIIIDDRENKYYSEIPISLFKENILNRLQDFYVQEITNLPAVICFEIGSIFDEIYRITPYTFRFYQYVIDNYNEKIAKKMRINVDYIRKKGYKYVLLSLKEAENKKDYRGMISRILYLLTQDGNHLEKSASQDLFIKDALQDYSYYLETLLRLLKKTGRWREYRYYRKHHAFKFENFLDSY